MGKFQQTFNPLTIQRFFVPSLAGSRLHCLIGRQMEVRQLRCFVAVAEALNFSEAATRRRVAQSVLRLQVMNLEDDLGVDLLKRNSPGVQLTADGKLFLEDARDMLKLADLKSQEGGQIHTRGRSKLRRLCPGSVPRK